MRLRLLGIALALAFASAGCGAAGESDGGRTQVVTSVYPLEYLASRIAGEHADVDNLTPPGAEPHDAELTIAQTARLSDADIAVHLDGFQPAVDDALAQQRPAIVVDVTEAADLKDADPHFWLDPVRMSAVAGEVQAALAEADPAHADDFAANLSDLRADLDALDADYRAGLRWCEIDTVVVSHDAFGYLSRYGLDLVPIAGLSPNAEPSPARLAELGRIADDTGVRTVFAERLDSPEMAETLAAELGLRTDVLDPIEGLAEETAQEDYLSLMRANLEALRKANRCT